MQEDFVVGDIVETSLFKGHRLKVIECPANRPFVYCLWEDGISLRYLKKNIKKISPLVLLAEEAQ